MKELERISDGAKGWRFLTLAVMGGARLLVVHAAYVF
jgi:hypothetical protein